MKPKYIRSDLIKQYQKMSDLTQPECKTCSSPRGPLTCCNKFACEITLKHARDVWNTDLRKEFDETKQVPFMGKNGCKIAPHLRPHCTFYTCMINVFGSGFNSGWTKQFYRLKNIINKREWELYKNE